LQSVRVLHSVCRALKWHSDDVWHQCPWGRGHWRHVLALRGIGMYEELSLELWAGPVSYSGIVSRVFHGFSNKNKLFVSEGKANRMNHVSEFPDLTHRRSHTLQSFATWLIGSRNFCPNQSGSIDMNNSGTWMSKLKESGPIG
jgi:hypothetical protein